MRIAPENENKGLNDDGSQQAMTTIRQGVEKFRDKLQRKSNLEELFAVLDQEFRLASRQGSKNSDRIIPGFRSVLKLQNLPECFTKLFEKRRILTESN